MNSLVALPYKPGIKKDSTPFDSEHCIDGSWVRFFNGRAETIGGMKQLAKDFSASYYSDILVVPSSSNKAFVYLPYSSGVAKLEFNLNPFSFSRVVSANIAPAFTARAHLRWQALSLSRPLDQKTYVAFLGVNDLADINDNSAPLFFYGPNEGDPALKLTSLAIDPAMNGGMCFAAPYLFLYGSGGAVRHSKNNDPFDFSVKDSDPASGGSYKIGVGDKVVYASPIRGGANASPSLLLWTLSSVVRMSNAGEDRVNFSVDIITKDSSILSSRCVIEHQGFFFWPGTSGFYVYNGVVRPLDNNMNRRFFFGNLNLEHRQKVFAVKNSGFNEVWWTWPNGGEDNNWALIFNYESKIWYDTAFASRSCGTFYGAEGIFLSFGLPKSGTFDGSDLSLWLHEEAVGQTWTKHGENILRIDPLSCSISFPYFSLSLLLDKNNSASRSGSDRYVGLARVFPDFVYKSRSTSPFSEINLIVNTLKYPSSIPASSAPYSIKEGEEKLDTREQGRYMSLRLGCDDFFQQGSVLLELYPGDGQ